MSDVTINVAGFTRFRSLVERELRSGSTGGPIRGAIRQWGVRYRAAMQTRYNRFSRGGGNWPTLAASTLRGRRGPRRGAQGPRRVSILRDTGLLFNALDPQFSPGRGAIQEDVPFGVTVGFGGPAKYPEGRASIADVAAFHQNGGRRLPKREILVAPDTRTTQLMGQDMQRGIDRALGQSAI